MLLNVRNVNGIISYLHEFSIIPGKEHNFHRNAGFGASKTTRFWPLCCNRDHQWPIKVVKSKVGSGPKSSNSERSAEVVERGDVYEVTSTTSSSSFQSYEFAISLELKLHDFLMHKGQKTTLLCALTIHIYTSNCLFSLAENRLWYWNSIFKSYLFSLYILNLWYILFA